MDDYFVIFIEAADVNDDNDVLAVSDVETVSGTVKTVKITDDMENGYNGSFTLDGTKYTLASGYNNVEINAGDEYDFFLDCLLYTSGHISSQTLRQTQASRTALVSGQQTLEMNISNYKAQLEMLIGAEQTGNRCV